MQRWLIMIGLAATALLYGTSATAQESDVRTWTDASGKFQVRARLVAQSNKVVKLHTDDGREIEVPLDRLSKGDLDYLKSLDMPSDNPFAGGTPASGRAPEPSREGSLPAGLRASAGSASAGEELPLPDTGTTIDLNGEPADEPFVPDAGTPSANLPAKVVNISPIDAYDKVSAPVPTDLAGGEFLVSIGRNKSGSPEETRGRIFSVDLRKGQAQSVWEFPRAVRVLDHDADSGRTLINDDLDQFQRGGKLLLVEQLGTGSPQVLLHRTLPGADKPGFAPQVQWARLLSGAHVAAILNNVLYVWDLPAAKLLYRMEGVAASEPPVFSGNQLYMAIPLSGKVVIAETQTGRIRKSFATGSTLRPGVAFDPSGRLLAVCFSNQYQVWDCVEDRVVGEATTTDHLGSHPVHWIGPRMFLGALGNAVHLDLGMSVWKYSMPSCTEPWLAGDKLLAATTSQSCQLVSVAVPHEAAEQSIERLMQAGDAAMLVRPGTAVALKVESTEQVDEAAIQEALGEAVEKAGWSVSGSAPITLVAKIGRGATETLRFRMIGGGPETVQTATLTPFTAELEIRRGANVLWTRSTRNHVPSFLHLEQDESVQDAVKRFEKPDAGFFGRLNLPPRIPKPEVSEEVGLSSLKDGSWRDIQRQPGGPSRARGPRTRPPGFE